MIVKKKAAKRQATLTGKIVRRAVHTVLQQIPPRRVENVSFEISQYVITLSREEVQTLWLTIATEEARGQYLVA